MNLLPLLSSLTTTRQGVTVLVCAGMGAWFFAALFVGFLWMLVKKYNERQYRAMEREARRSLLLWKARVDVEDSPLYRDFYSEDDFLNNSRQ